MPRRQRRALARLCQTIRRVDAHGLQQPVPALTSVHVDGHQRLVHQPRQQGHDRLAREAVVGAHEFGGGELESSSEHGESAEQHLFVGVEQPVAPVERRSQCLLAGRRRFARRPQYTESTVEPLRQGGGVERTEAPGGEFDRQRQSVETETDPGDVGGVVCVDGEARHRCRTALGEQLDRLVRERFRRRGPAVGVGNRQRRDPEHHLAGDAQWLATRGHGPQPRRLAQQRRGEPGDAAEHVLAVVQHQQQRPRAKEISEGVDE